MFVSKFAGLQKKLAQGCCNRSLNYWVWRGRVLETDGRMGILWNSLKAIAMGILWNSLKAMGILWNSLKG